MIINKNLHNEYIEQILLAICESYGIEQIPNSEEGWSAAKATISNSISSPTSVLNSVDAIRVMLLITGEVSV